MKCQHRWLCEPPDGHISKATCTVCGETREFMNSLPSEEEAHLFRDNYYLALKSYIKPFYNSVDMILMGKTAKRDVRY
jgi:hypothetical protein